MALYDNKTEAELIVAFKSVLREHCHSSQGQLAAALVKKGFDNISQSKISRMLSKLGAVKTRNSNSEVVYYLSDELTIPRSKQPIQSIVLSVKHNKVQIVLKTGIGGAPLIARILDIMGESAGILGTLAGDDTIIIVPTDIERIDEITQAIIVSLDLEGMT